MSVSDILARLYAWGLARWIALELHWLTRSLPRKERREAKLAVLRGIIQLHRDGVTPEELEKRLRVMNSQRMSVDEKNDAMDKMAARWRKRRREEQR